MRTKQKPRNRKPNNNHTRYERQAKASIRGLGLLFMSGSAGVDIVNVKTMKPAVFTDPDYYGIVCRALNQIQFKWTILLCVLCKDGAGSTYIKSRELELTEPRFNRDLAEGFKDAHLELWDEQNHNHRYAMAWAAYPGPYEFDPAQVLDALT